MQELITKIKTQLQDSNYFYVSNEIENGLGLEQVIPNFNFVYKGKSDVAEMLNKDGFKAIGFESESSKTSFDLLENLLNSEHFDKSKTNYFQTFKISPQFERAVTNVNGRLINTSSNLNRIFEGKISQSRMFEHADVSIPKTIIEKLGNLNYPALINQLSQNFVVQFDRGHTGLGTIFIDSAELFEQLKTKFPNRICRLCELVNGKSYTVNGCVTSKGIYLAGLNLQLTGIPELTSEKGGTVGNDFMHDLSGQIIQKLYTEVNKLQEFLLQNNYKGLIGFDFMVDEQSNIKLIEINARQPRSIPFSSQIQVINNQIPLNLLHVAAFLNIEIDLDSQAYTLANCQAFKASQIFVRNLSEEEIKIKNEFRSGEYAISSGSRIDFIKPAYKLSQIDQNNILVLPKQMGEIVDHGGEIARIQTLNSAYNGDELNKDYVNILTQLRNKLIN